jgi:hypothetical protein
MSANKPEAMYQVIWRLGKITGRSISQMSLGAALAWRDEMNAKHGKDTHRVVNAEFPTPDDPTWRPTWRL